ncbi:protein kinase domain-containing protein [Kibdelosporangium aridum]|uniref:Serine/threonine protein kinase n=1 Tax=Kibdelosporangium aridum TaxID=2030 RepID=A0A1W2FLT0_KIBAR|nr:protein kinase [Kibdelosporangium aridum]SMD22840.1 Serine/threonine protein kinase [Kibdelosporangium aridum]
MTATVTLRLIKGQLDRTEYVFDERTTCILGRADDCVPRLPSDESHRTVSRHHCLLDINPPDVRVRDLGSLNGTFVNGEKIGQREARQTPEEGATVSFPEHDLTDGDEIRLGQTVFRVDIRLPAGYRTLSLSRCAKCDGEVRGEPGDRSGVYVCADCQAEPGAAARRLVELAHSGHHELTPVAGYTLLRELGRGGMGAVYLARDEHTGQEVALKVMLPRVAASPVARARFLREVELSRALRHPNIAALHDVGFADGTFYFTTEYCAGGSLDQLLARRGGPLDVAEAVRLACQALAGVAFAHGEGVVHRDLTPHNILLGKTDGSLVAKVGDFGLAKAFDHAGLSGLTRTGATAGKPFYVPRQQVVNFRNVSPAVDVWALAACLYHALTGAYPRDFPRGKDPWRLVLQAEPVPIRQRDPAIPVAVAEVIDEALRENPGSAFHTADELREALLAHSC